MQRFKQRQCARAHASFETFASRQAAKRAAGTLPLDRLWSGHRIPARVPIFIESLSSPSDEIIWRRSHALCLLILLSILFWLIFFLKPILDFLGLVFWKTISDKLYRRKMSFSVSLTIDCWNIFFIQQIELHFVYLWAKSPFLFFFFFFFIYAVDLNDLSFNQKTKIKQKQWKEIQLLNVWKRNWNFDHKYKKGIANF